MPFLRSSRHLKWAALLGIVVVYSLVASRQAAATSGAVITTLPVLANKTMQLDANGNPVIASGSELLHCNDPHCDGGDDIPTPVVGGSGGLSLQLDAAGNPVISYVGTQLVGVTHCNDPNCLGNDEYVGQYTWVGPGSAGHTSLELDDAGRPVLTFTAFNGSSASLVIMHCNDPNCSSSVRRTIDTSVGNSSALEIGADGNPIISYARRSTWDLEVYRCGNPQCSGGGGSFAQPDPTGYDGDFSSIVMDSSGNPVITYFDSWIEETRLVHCNDPACLGGDEAVVLPGAPGLGFGLALDTGGNPVFAHGGVTDNFVLFHCGDPNCLAGNTTVTVVGEQLPFPYALELDNLGHPVVVYQDYGEPARLWRCITATCTAEGDTDGDGCGDAQEIRYDTGSELLGGRRNPKNPHDYFNPTGDGENRVDDVLAVVDAYYLDDTDGNPGLPPYAPGYNPDTDRTLLGPDAWDTGPPSGLQRVDDILNAVKQYFHDCAL